jgi:hypothetical protein
MSDSDSVLTIKNQDSYRTVNRLTNTIHAAKASNKAKLVFHRYGQNYFLSEIWKGGESTGRQSLKSKQERTMESQLAAISSGKIIAKLKRLPRRGPSRQDLS